MGFISKWKRQALALVLSVVAAGDICAAPENAAVKDSEADFAVQDDIDLNLARLAALEGIAGNGGADDGVDGDALIGGYSKKHGFHIGTADKNNKLRLRGRVHARYTMKNLEPRGGGTGSDISQFELERVRLGMQGNIFRPNVKFKVEFDAHSDGSKTTATDGYVYIKNVLGRKDDRLHFGTGQFKGLFMHQQAGSTNTMHFVDRTFVNEMFNLDRVVGAWVDGTFDRFYYRATLASGINTDNRSPTLQSHIPAAILRLRYNFLRDGDKNQKWLESDLAFTEKPAFAIGGAFAWDKNNGTAPGGAGVIHEVFTYQIDAKFKYRGFSVVSEYAARWVNFDPGINAYTHGAYITGGYFFLPKILEGAMRAGAVWDDGTGNTGYEVGTAATWYISKSQTLKLVADVSYLDIPANFAMPTENLWRGRALRSRSAGLAAGDTGIMTRIQMQLVW